VEHYVEEFKPKRPLYSRRVEEVAQINEQPGMQTIVRAFRYPHFECSGCHRLLPIRKLGTVREELTNRAIVQIGRDGTQKLTPITKKSRFCRRCSFGLRIKGFLAALFAPLRDIKDGEDD
jgi:hypothetical protein